MVATEDKILSFFFVKSGFHNKNSALKILFSSEKKIVRSLMSEAFCVSTYTLPLSAQTKIGHSPLNDQAQIKPPTKHAPIRNIVL